MSDLGFLMRVNVEEGTLLGNLEKINELARQMERITSDVMCGLRGELEKAADPMEESTAEKD